MCTVLTFQIRHETIQTHSNLVLLYARAEWMDVTMDMTIHGIKIKTFATAVAKPLATSLLGTGAS